MKTVHAIYANGVFRPKERVDLPEASEVEFEPRTVGAATTPGEAVTADDLPLSPVAIEIEQFARPESIGPDEA